jgi:TraB/PrgY/gumN family
MRRGLSQFCLAGILVAGAAAAQTPPPKAPVQALVQDWATETIVVGAHRHGPLFWRISRGDAEVWILAIVGPMPEDLAWDHSELAALLDGAKRVLLQPRAEIGMFEGAWFLLTQRSTLDLPNDAHLEDVIDASLKARFVAAREKLHRDADRYEDFQPAWAGFRLFGDFLHDTNLTGDEPTDTIKDLARSKDIPVAPIATYPVLSIVKDVSGMPPEASRACLRSALDDIEAEDAHQVPAAKAWSVGDLAGMTRHYSEPTIFACLQRVPSFSAVWSQSVTDTEKAVTTALDQGGKTVMVASLGTLLRKGGLLDRLRAHGITVESPE